MFGQPTPGMGQQMAGPTIPPQLLARLRQLGGGQADPMAVLSKLLMTISQQKTSPGQPPVS